MNPIKGIHYLVDMPWLIHSDDLTGPLGFFIFIELEKDPGTQTFPICKAIQNEELSVIGQWSQFFDEIFRRTVKTDVNEGSVLCLRYLNEVQTVYGGQAPGIIIPNDVISDIEPAEQVVQLADA
jgi:hypothetical protein